MSRKPKHAKAPDGTIDWDRQMQSNVQFAKQHLLETGRLTPTFVLHFADRTEIILAPFGSTADKERFIRLMQMRALAHNLLGAAHMGEVWHTKTVGRGSPRSRAEANAMVERGELLPPSQSATRKQGISISLVWRAAEGTLKAKSALFGIERDANGKPTATPQLMPITDTDPANDGFAGRFVPPRTPSADTQTGAAAAEEHLSGLLGARLEKQETRQ